MVTKKELKQTLLIILVTICCLQMIVPVAADLSTTDLSQGKTALDLGQALTGQGVTISNVVFTGASNASGTFSGGTGIIGFENGIILSTGDVALVKGPNNVENSGFNHTGAGDSSLDVLISGTTYDAAVLEFDFIPSTDTLNFEYVFGSEEYPEYANSNYNDAFGFFLNGENIALIPGTSTPVSINTVNGGNPIGTDPHNSQYYIDNSGGAVNTQLDGLTVPLNATAHVNRGVVNHIKLAIADVWDGSLDSDVFIKAGSFSSNPTITSCTPNQAQTMTSSVPFTLACSGFTGTQEVRLLKAGHANITASPVTTSGDGKTITGTFDLTNAAPGDWQVVAINGDGTEVTWTSGTFRVISNPQNIAITPSGGRAGTSVGFSVTGNGFVSPATVNLSRSGQTNITGTVSSTTSTGIEGTFPIPVDAQAGTWTVTVTNPDGQSTSLIDGFTVISNPSITTINPSSVPNGTASLSLTLNGHSLYNPQSVILTRAGSANITGSSITSNADYTSATCHFDLSSATPGYWSVNLTTGDDRSASLVNGLLITASPSITSVSPTSAAGNGPATLTLNGLDFYDIQNVNLTRAGSANITGSSITYPSVDNTSVTCVFNLAGATPGLWSVGLTAVGGATASKADAFTVNSSPVITGLYPSEGTHGSSVSPQPTIVGTGFINTPSPATVLLTAPNNSVVPAAEVQVYSGSANFVFPFLTAEPGTWQVQVKNGDGQVSNKMPLVVHDGGVVPLFTTNTTRGTNPLTVQFTNTSTGYVRSFSWNFGDGSPDNTTESNPSHTFTTPGNFTVTLTVFNNNNTAGVNNSTTIHVISVPAITGCTPASGQAGTQTTLHISGQQFVTGTGLHVNLTRSGELNITGCVDTATSTSTVLNSTFIIPADAKPGDWTLVVTNADDAVATWADTFKILSSPSITTITPVSGIADGRIIPFTLTGTRFLDQPAPLMVNLTRTGQPPITTVVSSSDQATINGSFTLPTGTATGAWTVQVTNGDGQIAQLPGAFTVFAPSVSQPAIVPPRISAITPSSGVTGTAVPVLVDGSDFQSGIALYLVRDGSNPIAATGLQSTGTQISGVFSLAGTGTGPWNVLVVNPDGGVGARGGAFTVTTSAPTTPTPVNTTPIPTQTVSFSANVTAGLSPLAVQFNESTTGAVQYFYWQFGDGSTSFDRNPIHRYNATGRYTVSLYAIDSNGYQVKTVDNYINVTSPVTPTPNVTTTSTITPVPTATRSLPEANFTVTPQGGSGSMQIMVADTSVNATSVRYDLGDGTTTAYQTFRYTYWQAGTYTIKQTATNAAGSSTKNVTVTIPATTPTPTITPIIIGGDQGSYTIHCNVDGATVLLDQTSRGTIAQGILKIQVYTTGTPFRTYTVQKDGYTTVSGTITQYPGKDQNVDITVNLTPATGQAQYNGPHNLPGLLQAEDYDLGGEGVAYHDTTGGNAGGVYRQDDVDIEQLDTDRSPNVGWIRAGEWLAYTVNVSTAGTYNAGFRVASSHAGSSVQVYVDDGTTPVATVNVPNTGDWPDFQTVSVPVTLPAGQHRLKLSFPTDYVNINWITFAPRGGV